MSGTERRRAPPAESGGWKMSGKPEGSRKGVGQEDLERVWESDREYCQGCQCRVDTGQMGLECGGCRRWYHAKCEKLTKKEYDRICEIDDKVLWHCGKCGDILPMILEENRDLKKEIKSLKQEFAKMKEEVATMSNIKTRIEECIKDIKSNKEEQTRLKSEKEDMRVEVGQKLYILSKKIEDSSLETKKEVEGKLEKKVKEIGNVKLEGAKNEGSIANLREEIETIKEGYSRGTMKSLESKIVTEMKEQVEQLERERRKNNLIIFSLKESDKKDPKERYKDDEEMCQRLLSKLGFSDLGIETTIRIGKKVPSRDRPLLMKLSHVKDVRMILQGKNKLKKVDGFMNVYIEKDLTTMEREQNKKLRRELYEKRDEGRGWFMIKGKKIVKVEPPKRETVESGGRTSPGEGVMHRTRRGSQRISGEGMRGNQGSGES